MRVSKTVAANLIGAALALSVGSAVAEQVTIRLGVAEIGVGNREYGSQGGGAVVHAERYLETEFKNEPDIRIVWSFFKGAGPAVNEALANRQIDFALQGDLPAIIARANGLKTKLVAGNGVRNNIYLAVTPKSGIARIEDLKGRKVAQFRGTNLQLAADKALAAHGLSEKDIKFISMDFPTSLAALATGDIDAAFGQADLLDLEPKGIAKVVYTTKGDDPSLTRHSHLLVTEEFERAHPDLTQRVVTQFVKADAWASDENNREALFEIWARSGRPAESFRADFAGDTLEYRLTPLLDDFLIRAYADKAEQAKEYRLLRGEVEIDGWFEPKYLDRALKDLGLETYWPRRDAKGREIAAQ